MHDYSDAIYANLAAPNFVAVVYARLCHYDVIAFISVLRICSRVAGLPRV